MFPLTKEPSDSFKSCSNVNTHAPGITLMFFSLLLSSLFLSWPLNAVPPMCAHCSLDSLAGSKTGTQHSCLLCCITHCLAVPVCVLFFLLFSRPLLTTNFFANSESSVVVVVVVCVFFPTLLKAVVSLSWNSITYSERGSLTCHFGALHAGLVSLVTGLCFLHSGWPPWAAGCRQIAVGWQISSSAPLICAVGPRA